MIIREVPFASPWYEQSKKLRQEVLRTPIGLVLSDKDIADEDKQIHIAAIEDERVVAVIILKPLGKDTIKFRQVAVAHSLQGQGIGKDLMLFAEALARSKRFTSIEMNARVSAQIFYEKLGYTTTGDIFIEVGRNTIKMVKTYEQ